MDGRGKAAPLFCSDMRAFEVNDIWKYMDTLTARPRVLKQANLSLIRKVLKAKGTATRAEIAYETKISSTTVRSLLSEMMQNGEIESVGYDESSGGRKAERYGFRPNRYYGAAFCITGDRI